MKTRVLLVEDHTVVREALRMLLSNPRYDIEVVGEAANGEMALEAMRTLQPDVIVMDLLMPDMDGLTAMKAILAQQPQTRVLILTGDETQGMAATAVQAGAAGFLRKSSSTDVLVTAVRALALGLSVAPRNLLAEIISGGDDAPQVTGPSLTEREQTVIACLARGLTNAEIGSELGISTATVRSHVSHLLAKLNATNRTQALHNAAALGVEFDQTG